MVNLSKQNHQYIPRNLEAKIYGEKLDKNADKTSDYVKDFRKSDAPQFKGKSDKKIQKKEKETLNKLSKKEK